MDQAPKTLCMAPWTHSYLSPQGERRQCCASREPAQNFKQYIDTAGGSGRFIPLSLEDHWNGDHMRSVRTRMLAGETLAECDVCNSKVLNTDVYRSYFNQLFGHKYQQAVASTDALGYTSMLPVSWDYRFSNLCNFKCRMCGDMLSSAWESEQKQHGMINWDDPKNSWMDTAVKSEISRFQTTTVEQEFSRAVEEHRIEEIYWVGGEPLMYEQHWRYMPRIIELGDGPQVYARYNTNLSRISYRGVDLFQDILSKVRDWQICASLDGTGAVGEYIRTGLDYDQWLSNFKHGLKFQRTPRQMRLDFTLTLPGMFEILNIQELSQDLGVEVLAKTVFAFSPDIVMSPLCLPRSILEPWINEILPHCSGSLRDILEHLKTRQTFQEAWPDSWAESVAQGKRRILQIESIRPGQGTMANILRARPEVADWWDSI